MGRTRSGSALAAWVLIITGWFEGRGAHGWPGWWWDVQILASSIYYSMCAMYDTNWEGLVSFTVLGVKDSRIIVSIFYYLLVNTRDTERDWLGVVLSQRNVS